MALPIAPAWAQIIDDYAVYMKAAARRPNTIRARREQLNHLARRMDVAPKRVTPTLLLRYVARPGLAERDSQEPLCGNPGVL